MAAELLFPKLVIFGASGPMGLLVVQQALQKGHLVYAVVRSPEKFNIKHENLDVIKGDVFNSESLVPVLEGKDAVVSCLGVHGSSLFRPTKLYSETMRSITSAMERSNLQRIVSVTSWATRKVPGNPKLIEWFLKPITMAGFIHDMAAMESILENSNLCYTVVRPPILNNDPSKGDYSVVDGQVVPGASWFIPRADVADFIVASLQKRDWDRKCMAIGRKT
ncbi:flavin reductase (NADPH)-like [Montipora foliosa]|uniref:flavin reductase (NADPH)-like n=1 Tax=Montipora foliosa TaxID=591990 RepID=UPI0035F1D644